LLQTGVFTSAIYAEDCIFEDPTIRFRGKRISLCAAVSLVYMPNAHILCQII